MIENKTNKVIQGSVPILNILVAVAQNGVIGRNNSLPWHIPEDLKRFKDLTMGQVCLMGRSTFESIGRVLPGRIFVVLSTRRSFTQPGLQVFDSTQAAIVALAGYPELFVIGGGKVYSELLPMASRLYVTRVYSNVEGDTHFEYDETQWNILNRSGRLTSKSGTVYEFIDYERKVG